ncbi:MAG: AAA family ATPase, partial [Chloroflexota bacterium]
MLSEWTISNFKSINEPVTLQLAPLTIFSGINSSGKSTILQSILTLCQTFMDSPEEGCLNLNGKYLQLGTISDIQHTG